MKVGQKIKKLREFKNLTQEYMAAQLEMSVGNYSKIERDEVSLTIDRLQKISEILNINFLDILAFDEKQVFNFIHNSHSQGLNIYQQNNYPANSVEQKIEEIMKRLDDLEKRI